MSHTCHAEKCKAYCPPEYLMCGKHWRMVPLRVRNEVYRTVVLRGPDCDASWAPWWKASHRAIAHAAFAEGYFTEQEFYRFVAHHDAIAEEMKKDKVTA